MQHPFKVSTGLKDLIGRDLITNDFVAVFELVKNSYDAHASLVWLRFAEEKIVIVDDGKGMSHQDILDKWLFVAYSAKRDETEDRDYRHSLPRRRTPFAGAKGVGRFSCDRLGRRLVLSSRAADQPVQILKIDWTRYEKDSKSEFSTVPVELAEARDFPDSAPQPPCGVGTVLEIRGLRSPWDRGKYLELKRELAKLINPFAPSSPTFTIEIFVPTEKERDREELILERASTDGQYSAALVNGAVENNIRDVLKQRTTAVRVSIDDHGKALNTVLEDRGEIVYRIREANPYRELEKANLRVEVCFLNRSAKVVFARRMGLPSVQFGSILLFRNGFRVFPIGQEDDDFFGLSRRKQQGMRRFLGTRDLIGCVEIDGVTGFDEATSRDQGLILTPQVKQLKTCVRDKCVRRLERYVVDITWKDEEDKEVEDTSRMKRDASSALVTRLVSRLAATQGVELLEYNPELVRIVDEKSAAFESSLSALELLAEKTGDRGLVARAAEARERIGHLQAAEAEAREAQRRADSRADAAERAAAVVEERYQEEVQRNQFLVAAAALDQDTILNLHHQIRTQAADVQHGVGRMMRKLRMGASVGRQEWIDFLDHVSFRNSQILTAARFATKAGFREKAANERADLALYVRDYVETVASLWAPRGIGVKVQGAAQPLVREFRPIEVGTVIDNLVSNAAKARATIICFFLSTEERSRRWLCVGVADDGKGWPAALQPLARGFEKGVTTTDGSGLGLYHVKQIVERLGGTVVAHGEPYSDELNGAHLTLRVPA